MNCLVIFQCLILVEEIAFIQTTNYYDEYGYGHNAWFTWKGTGKFSGETVEIPCHIGYLWGEDGKIINEWQHSDQTHFNAEVNITSCSRIINLNIYI